MALTFNQYADLSFGYLSGRDLLHWAPAQLLIKQNSQDANNPQDACNTAYNEIMAALGTRYDFTFELAMVGPTLPNVVASINAGAVNGVAINNPGSGYIIPPVLVFTGGGGTGAAGTVELDDNGAIASITITNGGTGYTSAPIISFTSQPFVPANVTAVITNGVLSGITINSPGSGYSVQPTVRISGGGGMDADVMAIIENGLLTGFNIFNGGCNYTSVPNVLLFGGQAVDNRDPLLVKILSILSVRNALGSFENISEKMAADFKWCDNKIMSIRNGQSNLALNVQTSSISAGPGAEAEMVTGCFSTLG